MTRAEYIALGGYEDHIRTLRDALEARHRSAKSLAWAGNNPWPLAERMALEDV